MRNKVQEHTKQVNENSIEAIAKRFFDERPDLKMVTFVKDGYKYMFKKEKYNGRDVIAHYSIEKHTREQEF